MRRMANTVDYSFSRTKIAMVVQERKKIHFQHDKLHKKKAKHRCRNDVQISYNIILKKKVA
jgi:hypothetical protein